MFKINMKMKMKTLRNKFRANEMQVHKLSEDSLTDLIETLAS